MGDQLRAVAQRPGVWPFCAPCPNGRAVQRTTATRSRGADSGAISGQARYSALAATTNKGLLRRIQPGARYENRDRDTDYHLTRRTCSRVVDVDCAVRTTPCPDSSGDPGYRIDADEGPSWADAARHRRVHRNQGQERWSHQKETSREEKDRRV